MTSKPKAFGLLGDDFDCEQAKPGRIIRRSGDLGWIVAWLKQAATMVEINIVMEKCEEFGANREGAKQ
jgi:hypothetical protein